MCIVRMERVGARPVYLLPGGGWTENPAAAQSYPSHVAKDVAGCFNVPNRPPVCIAVARQAEEQTR